MCANVVCTQRGYCVGAGAVRVASQNCAMAINKGVPLLVQYWSTMT